MGKDFPSVQMIKWKKGHRLNLCMLSIMPRFYLDPFQLVPSMAMVALVDYLSQGQEKGEYVLLSSFYTITHGALLDWLAGLGLAVVLLFPGGLDPDGKAGGYLLMTLVTDSWDVIGLSSVPRAT